MTYLEIPQAAIKAGAVAHWNDVKYSDEMDWVDLDPEDAEVYRNAAQVVLEAALPHLLAEVKVLTETAGEAGRRIGWKAAGEEVARAIERGRHDDCSSGKYVSCLTCWALDNAARIAREVSSQPSQAASDATSGVPRHSEVSEAVRSPQEPCGHPTCPCASQEAR